MRNFPRTRDELNGTYDQMALLETVPLWEIYKNLVAREPNPVAQPWIWRYRDVRPLLLQAGESIDADDAERRVMVLANPGLGKPTVTHTLIAGLQLVMPNETAPCHRHTQSALRFVLEGDSGYTAVNGERCTMERGDLILNPSWAWHDHVNTGNQPLIWLDGLDVPLTNFLGATFAEELGTRNQGIVQQPIDRADDESLSTYGSGLVPTQAVPAAPGSASPVNRYPYGRAREALTRLLDAGRIDESYGVRLAYVNPRSGSDVMPTLSAYLQMLPAGFKGQPSRSTASFVFTVVEGEGTVTIGERRFEWAENDVFVVPNWTAMYFESSHRSVLFSFSDAAALKMLGLYREQCGNEISP